MPDEKTEQPAPPAPKEPEKSATPATPAEEEPRGIPPPVHELIRDPLTLEVSAKLTQRRNGVFRELPVNLQIRLRRPPVRELVVEVRLASPQISEEVKTGWKEAVREKWSDAVFVDLRGRANHRYPVQFKLAWFERRGNDALSLSPARDFGYLLGNPDESGDMEFTNLSGDVVTMLWNKAPFLPGIMSDLAGEPHARNYYLIGVKVAGLLGIPFPARHTSEWRIELGHWRHTGDYFASSTN